MGEGQPSPLYLAMGELAHYIVDAYVRGNTAEFGELFAAIEVALQEENTELHSLLSVGLFEDIQNISSHRTFDSKSFRHWLGRESLRAWDQVDAGMREVAAGAAERRPRWWQFDRRNQRSYEDYTVE